MCYTRFYQFYSHCIGLSAGCMEWAELVRAHLPSDDPHLQVMITQEFAEIIRRDERYMIRRDTPSPPQWNAMRRMVGAMHFTYYSLTGGVTEEVAVISANYLGEFFY